MRKKLACFAIFVAMITTIFSSCVWEPPQYFFTEDDLANVTSVELVYCDFGECKRINDIEDVLLFDSDKVEVIEILKESNKIAFINELIGMEFLVFDEFTDCQTGSGIRINYSNGQYIIATCGNAKGGYVNCGAKKYDEDGICIHVYGSFGFRKTFIMVVNKYFDRQIEYAN